MTAILTALSPFIISGLTQLAKTVVPSLLKVNNLWIIGGVAVLSYLAAIGQASVSGQPVDPIAISTLATAIVNLVGASGVYFFGKKITA